MIKVKEMSYQEKYEGVVKNIRLYETTMPEFVRVHLGEDTVSDLHEEWQIGIKRPSIGSTPEEEYQTAYENWIWIEKTSFRFVRERMGEEGVRNMEQTILHALIQQNKGWSLVMLNLVRLVSPDAAFKMVADQTCYDLQWLTPYFVSEAGPHKLVIEIERCKILDYENTEDLCQLGCQQIYPRWVANQFMTDMSFERSGRRCTCTLKPIDWIED